MHAMPRLVRLAALVPRLRPSSSVVSCSSYHEAAHSSFPPDSCSEASLDRPHLSAKPEGFCSPPIRGEAHLCDLNFVGVKHAFPSLEQWPPMRHLHSSSRVYFSSGTTNSNSDQSNLKDGRSDNSMLHDPAPLQESANEVEESEVEDRDLGFSIVSDASVHRGISSAQLGDDKEEEVTAADLVEDEVEVKGSSPSKTGEEDEEEWGLTELEFEQIVSQLEGLGFARRAEGTADLGSSPLTTSEDESELSELEFEKIDGQPEGPKGQFEEKAESEWAANLESLILEAPEQEEADSELTSATSGDSVTANAEGEGEGDLTEEYELYGDQDGRPYLHIVSVDEVREILEKARAKDLKILYVRKCCEWVDHLVFASGRSSKHLRGMADAIVYKVKQRSQNVGPNSFPLVEGRDGEEWMAVDCGSIVVHLFLEDARSHYNLEDFWSKKSNFEFKELTEAF